MNPYAGQQLTIAPGLAVGFDADGRPSATVAASANGGKPSPEQMARAVSQAVGNLRSQLAMLTTWQLAHQQPERRIQLARVLPRLVKS